MEPIILITIGLFQFRQNKKTERMLKNILSEKLINISLFKIYYLVATDNPDD